MPDGNSENPFPVYQGSFENFDPTNPLDQKRSFIEQFVGLSDPQVTEGGIDPQSMQALMSNYKDLDEWRKNFLSRFGPHFLDQRYAGINVDDPYAPMGMQTQQAKNAEHTATQYRALKKILDEEFARQALRAVSQARPLF